MEFQICKLNHELLMEDAKLGALNPQLIAVLESSWKGTTTLTGLEDAMLDAVAGQDNGLYDEIIEWGDRAYALLEMQEEMAEMMAPLHKHL